MSAPEPPPTVGGKALRQLPWRGASPAGQERTTPARATDLARVQIESNVPMRTVIASARVQRIELLTRMDVGDSVLVDHRTAARLRHETYCIDCGGIKVRVCKETATSSRVWRMK